MRDTHVDTEREKMKSINIYTMKSLNARSDLKLRATVNKSNQTSMILM